ncbi:nucleotide-binding protein [Dactylosporangium sp. AC04546]|uniref:TIR domain-containing protein n=1 Tax=Dactylosporangium sp. AC04546 TaxID=2862460 RepID=UPI001EDFFC34|nr:TIR domain-containing protein [Dactylosporangium sp. AC04546]WVK88773.1 nucleotide-binding protein [Dactylosporangium sp. AC04546]
MNLDQTEPLAEVRVFLAAGTGRSTVDSGPEVDIGVVRFGGWQVRPLPSPDRDRDVYLVRAAFDLELAPAVPGPEWAEVGFEFTGGRVRVRDAVPRSVVREQDGRTYTLTPDLGFAEGGTGDIFLEGLRPTIQAFGIQQGAFRWRHTATGHDGVPAGSHTGWLVLEAPAGDRELVVRMSAAYALRPEDAMGLEPGCTPVERTVTLPSVGAPRPVDDAERARNVFLVHGRDDEFAGRMRELLSLLGLRVLEWEPLVRTAGLGPAPMLREVIHDGMRRAQAIVVLMTPDDVVSLHPDLRSVREDPHELAPQGQPRPNVLMELGAAMFAFPEATIVVKAGHIRPMADLGGVNFIDFRDVADAGPKLVNRLRVAGCIVDDTGQEWRRRARFEKLAAYDRRPPGAQRP